MKQHFGVLGLYKSFATQTRFWHKQVQKSHFGLVFGVPRFDWRCASFALRLRLWVGKDLGA